MAEAYGKTEHLVGRLSAAERRSLRTLQTGWRRRAIPAPHEEKLIELGLAELVGGAPDLTGAGRRVLAMIGGW